jgi:hypothetical protein
MGIQELCLKSRLKTTLAITPSRVLCGAVSGDGAGETSLLLLAGGLVLGRLIARLNDHGVFGWISLRAQGSLSIPKDEGDTFH